MQERRKHARLHKNENTLFATNSSARHQATILDISLGGMRIGSSSAIAVGEPILGQFTLLPNAGAFHIKGKVTWIKPDSNGYPFEIGITFTKICTIPLD